MKMNSIIIKKLKSNQKIYIIIFLLLLKNKKKRFFPSLDDIKESSETKINKTIDLKDY